MLRGVIYHMWYGTQVPSWLTSRLGRRLHSRAGHTGQGRGRAEDEVGKIGWGQERGLGMTAVCSDAVSSCDLQNSSCHMIRSTAYIHSVHTHVHVKNPLGIFRELVKNQQPPGIEPGASVHVMGF